MPKKKATLVVKKDTHPHVKPGSYVVWWKEGGPKGVTLATFHSKDAAVRYKRRLQHGA